MLKVLKNRTLDELVNCFYTSKKRAVVLAQEDVTSLYAEMAPLIASNETNSYMKKVIKNGDSVLAIAGAFDHLADMVLHGAKNIMAVDVNELQFPICWLKYWSFCFFTLCRDYMDFILNPTSKKMLDTDIMKSVLDFVPDGDMKEFWKRIYEQTSPLEIRRNYLYGEQKFIITEKTTSLKLRKVWILLVSICRIPIFLILTSAVTSMWCIYPIFITL